MKRMVCTGLTLMILTSAGCSMWREARIKWQMGKMKNKMAPDFELTALDGGKVRLSDLRGKPVLLAFWAGG